MAIASAESVCLSHLYPYERPLHGHVCMYISFFPTDQTFHKFRDLDTELDFHRIMSGFQGAFATGVACQQGTLNLLDT